MRFTMVKIVYQIRVFTLHVHVINIVIVYDIIVVISLDSIMCNINSIPLSRIVMED